MQSLVSTLLTTLPVPLTIHHSDKDVVSQYLAEDLVQLNILLQYSHCSLERLTALLSGYCEIVDDEMTQLLRHITTNKVPQCWPNPLPVTMDLTTYINVVQRRALFHQQWSSANPSSIDLALFSHIPVLLDTLKVQYCCDNGVPAEEACLSCQVSYHPSYTRSHNIITDTTHQY